MSEPYTIDEMREALRLRAGRSGAMSLASGVGDLVSVPSRRRRLKRPRMKPVADAMRDDWRQMMALARAVFIG